MGSQQFSSKELSGHVLETERIRGKTIDCQGNFVQLKAFVKVQFIVLIKFIMA